MRLDFAWSDDGVYHQYCLRCHAEAVQRTYDDEGRTFYQCAACGQTAERSIVLDPAITWWVAPDGEYWHESSGVFLRNPSGQFLFYERTIFPFALTVPSGHVDTGEQPAASAAREVKEEVGIALTGLTLIGTDDVLGDSCRRGADAHRWHAFLAPVVDLTVEVAEEGRRPLWLTLDEAAARDLTVPVRHAISLYRHQLQQTAR
ncbi:NUDIX hydrolase [Frankia sp. CNm7]|uniref:NUDIX hydrolase n=1 Tax=Frankia nepalensis TaxID=1836974 RepID=A0A937REU8_9ACTN|nr:NUDIX hydrolase [Frankia nepalensis]MBL7496943.1 NUDIX hydrolase [Frankia nepalensis]MBL7513433.1 NUDIX hydrolase [Frankia nepalensis]MBL7519108.1 NUDIX hydrolase [Frankia nepalensis]MBL7626124.1 NUDIX hydrolase [Frankia nepalensis]